MTAPLVIPLEGAALPAVFRRQLLGARPVVLEGTMDRIWRRRPILYPLFAALARLDVLFPETGRDVACRLEIARRAGVATDVLLSA